MSSDPEARFRAWLRSVDRVFVPPRTQIMAAARDLGLTASRTRQILASEPELTRLMSGRVPKSRAAFRLRLWSQAEIDLGFLNRNHNSLGVFFLGNLFHFFYSFLLFLAFIIYFFFYYLSIFFLLFFDLCHRHERERERERERNYDHDDVNVKYSE